MQVYSIYPLSLYKNMLQAFLFIQYLYIKPRPLRPASTPLQNCSNPILYGRSSSP